jgi:hypothetical protein
MNLGTGIDFNVYNSIAGGNSWQLSQLNTSSFFDSDYPNNSIIGGGDIVFAYDKNGVLYCSWIYLSTDNSSANPLDSALWTSYWATSIDNGNTFTLASGVDHFFGRGKVNLNGGISVLNYEEGILDRQWMAVDLSNGPNQNNLYIGYINYPFNVAQTGLKVKRKVAGQNSFSAASTAYAGSGQLTNIAVDSNGVLHYTFADIAANQLFHVSSTDGGQTFSSSHLVSSVANPFPSGIAINDRENSAPSLAIDGRNNLHLVWGSFPSSSQQPDSYYSLSIDNGNTWSSPLNLTTLFGSNVFMPVVSVKNNHITIAGNVLDAQDKSAYTIVSSFDNGVAFSPPVKVSSGIVDFAAVGQGVFVGDYSSGVRTNCMIYSLWTDCGTNGCKQYVSKYDECNATGVTELTAIESTFSLKNIYPIPAKDYLNLSINSQIKDNLKIEVYNSIGQKVIDETEFLIKGDNKEKLFIGDIKSGNYILRLINDNGTLLTRNFVKN